MKAEIVGQFGFAVIVESPGAARVVNQMTELVLFVRTLPGDPARLAVRTPQFRIDASFGIDGSDEGIGDLVVAVGMAGLAGEHDADLPELGGQGGIEDRL